MDRSVANQGRVILFGKTGAGKSTVANALVTGGIESPTFVIGHGVKGCTFEILTAEGRGWTVTDTVGLGEGKDGTVKDADAERIILDFLKKVRGDYSHVIYVKSALNRFDVLDEYIWKVFRRIFKGAENAFTVLFTNADEKGWLMKNWDMLPQWVKDLGEDNVLSTDIPPILTDPRRKQREARNAETRRASIEKLEQDLLKAFQRRGGRYATPDICRMNDAQLEDESKSIFQYISQFFVKSVKAAAKGLAATAGVVTSVTTILEFLALFA